MSNNIHIKRVLRNVWVGSVVAISPIHYSRGIGGSALRLGVFKWSYNDLWPVITQVLEKKNHWKLRTAKSTSANGNWMWHIRSTSFERRIAQEFVGLLQNGTTENKKKPRNLQWASLLFLKCMKTIKNYILFKILGCVCYIMIVKTISCLV